MWMELKEGWKSNTRMLLIFFGASGLLGIAVLLARSVTSGKPTAQIATPYLWALACVAVGSLVGFLFGIPRTTDRDTVPVSSLPAKNTNTPPHPPSNPTNPPNPAPPGPGEPDPGATNPAAPHPADHQPAGTANAGNVPAGQKPTATESNGPDEPITHVNTNLEQVSDWLTKIIVGVGLTQLQHIPAGIRSVASTLDSGLDPAAASGNLAFAEALIVYFTVIGFLFAYLLTRVYLQKVFDGAQPRQLGGGSHTNIVVAQ